MLVGLELLQWSDAAPFIKQFDAIDRDRSGVLTHDDLQTAARALNEASRGRSERRCMQRTVCA